MTQYPYSRPASLLLLGKGGAGKTTSALSLASISASMGWRTIVLDADPQRSASEWYALNPTGNFAVHTTEVGAVSALLNRAKKHYDIVFIDHPPTSYGGANKLIRAADHCMICARPYQFDITQALEWVDLVKTESMRALVALTAASPRRQGKNAPIVEKARQRLAEAGADIWRGQVTHRLTHPELIARGKTIAELPTDRPARTEYESLWSALRKQVAASHG